MFRQITSFLQNNKQTKTHSIESYKHIYLIISEYKRITLVSCHSSFIKKMLRYIYSVRQYKQAILTLLQTNKYMKVIKKMLKIRCHFCSQENVLTWIPTIGVIVQRVPVGFPGSTHPNPLATIAAEKLVIKCTRSRNVCEWRLEKEMLHGWRRHFLFILMNTWKITTGNLSALNLLCCKKK